MICRLVSGPLSVVSGLSSVVSGPVIEFPSEFRGVVPRTTDYGRNQSAIKNLKSQI